MIRGILLRCKETPNETLGYLIVGDLVLATLEPPWLDNRRNVSCISAGTYPTRFLAQSASGKYRHCWHIEDVPNRYSVLIHSGNTAAHTKGCVLVGMRHGYLAGNPAVLNSRAAINALSATNRDTIALKVTDGVF